MATRLIEPLNIDALDANGVRNWIERLGSAIEISLFTNGDQLPTEEGPRAAMIGQLKKNYLLSSVGQMGYKYLRSYCAPTEPADKTYEQLIELLKQHLAPAPKHISEQYKFSLLKQDSGESLSSFMSRVKEAATTCAFEGLYDRMVRDRFICGLWDSKIRTSLLSGEDDMTSNQAFEKAVIKEKATQSSNQMTGKQPVHSVKHSRGSEKPNNERGKFVQNKVKSQSGTLVCSKCTLRGHTQDKCTIRCRKCKLIGHIAKNCVKGSKRNVRHTDVQDGVHFVPGEEDQNSSPLGNSNHVSKEDTYGIYKVEEVQSECVIFPSYQESVSTEMEACKLLENHIPVQNSKIETCDKNKLKNDSSVGFQIDYNSIFDLKSVNSAKKPIIKLIVNGQYV